MRSAWWRKTSPITSHFDNRAKPRSPQRTQNFLKQETVSDLCVLGGFHYVGLSQYAGIMASYLDQVPFSGIIRIRDMMYSIADPYRLDQGDVSFDAPDSVKSAMTRAIAENRSHYLQTNGVPRLRELIAAKLRDRNRIPVNDADDVLVTHGGIHALYIACMALIEPGDEVLIPDPEWPPTAGNILAARGVPVGYRLHEANGWRPDFDDLESQI